MSNQRLKELTDSELFNLYKAVCGDYCGDTTVNSWADFEKNAEHIASQQDVFVSKVPFCRSEMCAYSATHYHSSANCCDNDASRALVICCLSAHELREGVDLLGVR